MTRSQLTRSFGPTRSKQITFLRPARRDNPRIPSLATLSTRSEQILNDSCLTGVARSTLMETVLRRKEFNIISELANFSDFSKLRLSTAGDVHLSEKKPEQVTIFFIISCNKSNVFRFLCVSAELFV